MLKELLGDAYKDGMTFDDIETALQDKKLVDLSGGEYVSKGKLTDALNKAKVAEGKFADLSKEYEEYKNANMTDAEKQKAKAEADAEELSRILKENETYKKKEALFNNGYTSDEVAQLIETDFSPETFAKITNARVDDAVKKKTANGIKETVKKPAAENNLEKENSGTLADAIREKFSKE